MRSRSSYGVEFERESFVLFFSDGAIMNLVQTRSVDVDSIGALCVQLASFYADRSNLCHDRLLQVVVRLNTSENSGCKLGLGLVS